MADEELTDIMVDMEFGELMKDWIEDWSDDENSDREDRSENGNEWDDLNIDEFDDDQENNSELSNEDYISQFIFECHNAYDYYGESDAETGLNDESLDAPGSGESESSVIMSEVTQDDGAKNVQDIASADDKRDMFMQIMEMTFTSHDAAYDFYNSYARDNGFSIRKNKVRYSKTESRHMRYRRFVCSRQGKRDNKLLTEEGHSRRLRAETRCFCKAHLTVKLDQKHGVWYVESFEGKHSHMLAGPDKVRGNRMQPPTRLIPWFSKTEGNTYATLLHHPFLFGENQRSAQEVARRISSAVAGEVYAKVNIPSITPWHRYVLDTITGGNFLGSHTFDSYNAMLDLFGSPPLLVNGTILTLEHVMQRLEIIENKVAIVELIENLDKKIHSRISQYGSKVGVTLKDIKEKEPIVNEKINHDSTRIDKLEDIITNLGTAFFFCKEYSKSSH
uniref:Far1 n=1 Tax=Triticum aestivum TaxID=4565 RepID=D0QEK9_WHEAT|nr:Far1 [Triticum aestivum]